MSTTTALLQHYTTLHELALAGIRLSPRDLTLTHNEDRIVHALNVYPDGHPAEPVSIASTIVGLRAARIVDRTIGAYSITDRFTKAHAGALACARVLDGTRYAFELDAGADIVAVDLGYHRANTPPIEAELNNARTIAAVINPFGAELLSMYRATLLGLAIILLDIADR